MTDVEQKVVQMRFDDKDFDEKAQKTMKTLDKLNNMLSFDAVAKKSDAAFKEVADNVEKIADQAYTIIDRVIDKIKDSIATNIFNFISDTIVGQVKTGWQKYADMTQAVGTLASQGHKMEDINDVLERLAFFSDETNYNFNNMLNNIGKFTAAGVKLQDAEQSLEGIAGMAGLSGVNAQRASIAMDQMAQAMGSYLKKADWVSIQTANLDTMDFRQTLIDTGVAMGTLKKESNGTYVSLRATSKAGKNAFTAETGFLESLTQGAWATTDVMVETYKKYGAAVDKVYQKVEEDGITASEAIRELSAENKILLKQYMKQYNVTEEVAIKELDKISMIRKATDEEIEQYAKLHKVSKKVAEATLNADYNKVLKDWQKTTHKTLEETEKELDDWAGWTNAKALKAFTNAQEARTFEDVINSVKEAVSSNWRSIYASIFGDYAEAKKLWTDMANGLVDLFAGRLYEISEMFEEWHGLEPGKGGRTDLWQGLYAFAYGIRDIIQEVRDVWNKLITDGESGMTVLQTITKKIQEAGFKFYIFVTKLIEGNFFANITEALHNIKAFIDQVFGALYDGVRDAIPGGNFFLGLLIELSSLIKDITANFKLSDTAVEGLRKTFKGLFIILNSSKRTIIDVLVKIVLPVLNAVFSVLGNIIDVVVTITGTLGDIIEYFMPLDHETSGWVMALQALAEVLSIVIKLIGEGLSWVLQKIVPLIGVTIGSVVSLGKAIGELFNTKKIKMGSGSNLIKGFTGLKDKILEAWEPLKSFTEIIDEYKDGKGLTNFLNLFTDITDGIGNRLLLTMDATVGFIEVLGESKFGKALQYAISALRWVIRAGLWLFNNLLVPALKEIVRELGLTIESVKAIIEKDGILGLLKLIQEVFKTGIFGEIVNTINLINSILGSNGIGKLFSKGAKALDSIASYFNAAKLNAAADVMLKIVAAMGLLYTLLALITFLPQEHYEAMKNALLEFGIALGIVVGGVFVISAAAALAGENLVALAGAFIGIGIAIMTAFWSIKKMSELIDTISTEKIDAGLKKLEEILSEYSWIIIKVIAPFALLSTRYSGSIAGIGAVFVGLAASIWVLIKAMQEIDTVKVSDIDKIAEFISGVYLVFAASTALMVLASAGKDVHGISIAIASIGVAFAAIKMILPLCKDVIAEKDVILDAQGALATFGLFVLAFAASMYFIMSGVKGIISGIVSILLFRGFISIVTSTIIPALKELVIEVASLTNILTNAAFNSNAPGQDWFIAFGAIFAGFLVGIIGLVAAARMLIGWWADIDPMALLWMAVTIVGGMVVFAKVLLPEIEKFGEYVKTLNPGQIYYIGTMLGLVIAPIFAIAAMFVFVMWRFQHLYENLGMARIGINIGIFTRQYNAVASMFQSIMLAIMFMYAGIAGVLALVTFTDFKPEEMQFTLSVLTANVVMIGILIGGIAALWGIVTTQIRNITQFGTNANIVMAGQAIYSISSSITWLMVGINLLTLGIMAIAAFVIGSFGSEGAEKLVSVMRASMAIIIPIIVGIGAFLIGFTFAMAHLVTVMNTTAIQSNPLASSQLTNMVKVVSVMMITIMILSTVLVAISALMAQTGDWGTYIKTLVFTGIVIAGIMAALAGFIWIVTRAMRSNSYTSFNAATGEPLKPYTYMIELIAAMGGLVLSLLVIGAYILPAVKDLQQMDLGKLIVTFLGILALILAPAAAIRLMSTVSVATGGAAKWGAWAQAMLSIVIPLASITASIYFITEQLSKLAGISDTTIAEFNKMIIIIGAIGTLLSVISMVGGAIPAINAGIIGVALALGGMIALIGLGIYLAGQGIALIRGFNELVATGESIDTGRLSRGMRKAGNDATQGYADGMTENIDIVENAGEEVGEAGMNGAKEATNTKSPSKEFMKLGKFCDQGLALGIKRNTKDVVRASRNLAYLTESVFEDDLEIASPSKVFYKNGRFIVAGLQDGITSKKSSLADTMSDLGDTLAKSINEGFEGVNIDIWGGKDPIDVITEKAKELDAGSIIGKMLGLDGEEKVYSDEYLKMVKNISHEELERLAYIESMGGKTPDWFANRLVNKSLGAKIGDKVMTGLKEWASTAGGEALKSIGSFLGIEAGDGATGSEALDNLKKKIIGDGETTGVIGTIKTAIFEGKWPSLIGDEMGGSMVESAIEAIKKSNFGQRLGLFFRGEWKRALTGAVYSDLVEVGTTYENKGKPYEKRLNDYWKITKEQYEAFRGTLSEYSQEKLDVLFSKASELVFQLPENINGEDLFWAIEDDFGNKFSKLIENIGEGAIGEVHNYGDKIRVAFSDEDEYTIKEISGDWKVNSPSRVMRNIYQSVGEGAILGIKDMEPSLLRTIKDSNDEQYREMSLGVQALDELASGETVVQPRLVPIIDTASMAAFTGITDAVSGVNGAKISASLDYSGSFSFLAAGQAAIVSAVDAMKRDLLNSLSLGELVKVDVNSTVNDNNLFDHFVDIDRQEYNRTGRHAW